MKKIRDNKHFIELCDWCIKKEPKLKLVISQFGYPPFWHREPNFETLILTILEQQVSLASAKAAYIKLAIKYMKKFSPYQSAATYILWHNYIQKRNLRLE